MIYPKEFEQLIRSAETPDFVGWGNPNAKILLLGKEPAKNLEDEKEKIEYEIEVAGNKADWRRNIAQQTGFNEVVDEFRKSRISGNPLCPHCWQKYRVKNRKNEDLPEGEGTARTWYQYQKLIDMIFGKTSKHDDFLDFHKYCFSTDMSAAAALDSSGTNPEVTRESIEKRRKFFKDDSFFKQFPIIIAAVGHYPKRYASDFYFKDSFSVEWVPEKSIQDSGAWINVNEAHENGGHRLLLHTCQTSAPLKDEYFESIAAFVRNFAKDYNLDLNPVSF